MSLSSFLYKAGAIVGSGGLIFGYDIGVISGTLGQLKDEFNLSDLNEGVVVSILYAGSIFGSLIGGPLCDKYGRWKAIQIQNAVFVLGAMVISLSTNFYMLCAGRFIVGIAAAVSGIADVPYLTEIAPPEFRGLLSSQYEILVCVGILLSFSADLIVSRRSNGWRIAFLVPAILAIIQSFGMLFLPETPKWLIEKDRLDEAKEALSQIYGNQYFLHEIDVILSSSHTHRRRTINNMSLPQDLLDYQAAVARHEQSRMQQEQRLHGHTSAAAADHGKISFSIDDDEEELWLESPAAPVHHHTPPKKQGGYLSVNTTSSSNSLLPVVYHRTSDPNGPSAAAGEEEGNGSKAHHGGYCDYSSEESQLIRQYQYAIAIIVVVQVLAQITGANVIRNYAPTIFEDNGVSSRMALAYNVILGTIKLIFTVVSVLYVDSIGRMVFFTGGIITVCVGMAVLTLASFFSIGGDLNNPVVFMVGCSFVYAGFGVSYGPIPWILSAEMFPTLIRGRIVSISLIASNISQLVTNLLFLLMTEHMTTGGTFGFFLVLNLLTLIFVRCLLVESKEIQPDDILQQLLKKYEMVLSSTAGQLFCCSSCSWLKSCRRSCCCCSKQQATISEYYSILNQEGGGHHQGSSRFSNEQPSVNKQQLTSENVIATGNLLGTDTSFDNLDVVVGNPLIAAID